MPCKHSILVSLFLILCFLRPGAVLAQDYVISLQHWDSKEGLAHRQVNSIAQDKEGFLWLGTSNGLSRFDGKAFVNYNSDNAGLPFNDIRHLVIDASGILWLLKGNGAANLCRFNPQTRKAEILRQAFPRYIARIFGLKDGRVFFGSEAPNEWYLYDGHGSIRRVPVSLAEPFNIVGVTERNTLWISRQASDFYEQDLQGKILRRWTQSGTADLSFSTFMPSTGIYGIYNQRKDIYHIDTLRGVHDASYIGAADMSRLEFLFNTGLDDIAWRQGRLYHPRRGLIRDFIAEGWDDLSGVRACYILEPGEIWLGGSFGLYRLEIGRSKFRRLLYNAEPVQDPHNGFRNMLVRDSKLYAAGEELGILTQDLANSTQPEMLFSGLAHDAIRFYAMALRPDSSFLFSIHRKLYEVDRGDQVSLFGNCGDSECWSISEWGHDSLLMGLDKGLGWMQTEQRKMLPFTDYGHFTSLSGALVHAIIPAGGASYWICASNGLYRLDRTQGITALYSASGKGGDFLPATCFYHCTRDADGSMWLATAEGLIHWNISGQQFKVYSTRNGLSNNTIYAVYPDDYGKLWMSSDYGLMSLDKKTGRVNRYLVQAGITNNEFNRISHYRDEQGSLYFGSLNGITAFHPKDFLADGSGGALGYHLAISSFQQFDGSNNRLLDKTAEVLRTQHIRIQPSDRFFTLEMALLDFEETEHASYYWKIDGLDRSWNVQSERTLRVSTLPYGHYQMQIKARAANGSWSANQWTLQLDVLAPFYRQGWFLIACAIALLLGSYGLYRRRTHQLQADKTRLENTVQQRTEDLQVSLRQKDVLMKEIHHRVKNNLQVISSLQHMQSTRSSDPVVKAALEESQNRVLSIAFIHHNLYSHDDLKGVEMHSFIAELTTHINTVFARPGLSVEMDLHIAPLFLDIDTAVPLGLIVNELLSNSFKYAFSDRPKGHIRVELTAFGEHEYELKYKDDGPGLREEVEIAKTKTLGLKLITQLSRQIGGHMQYSFESGSLFTLRFMNSEARNL